MEMAYRERWRAEIAELRRILSGFDLKEECKWAKPCYTLDGRNVVIIQGFKEYCALGFFQGALLTDPKTLLVQLGQVRAARLMKFTGAEEIAAKAATLVQAAMNAVTGVGAPSYASGAHMWNGTAATLKAKPTSNSPPPA